MSTKIRRAVKSRYGVTVGLIVIGSLLAIGAWGWSTSGAVTGRVILKGSGTSALAISSGPSRDVETHHFEMSQFSFIITGNIGGLYPGATLPLTLSVFNVTSTPIEVTTVTTTVMSLSRSCAAANVTVSSFHGGVPVAAHRSANVVVHVELAHTAPNSCQGKMFLFLYRGQATSS